MTDQAAVSLLRWLRRLLRQMDFTDAQRRHVAGLLDRWADRS